jgi:TonB family protein
MKLHEHERDRPSIAGFTSPVQQAEMQLLLAGRWPALKPLPVFKFETAEYRASMDFDKTRGEWVCRKTFLPSNKVQELRGGLTEITMALPHGPAQVFAECAAAEKPEQELPKDASRRLQAILEWREHYENGGLYSGLQDYLSESQQNEIADSIRLTLTARQLQFSPKNVAYVFDALSKAGGKLSTLVEIAQRNKTEQTAEAPAKAQAAAAGVDFHVPVQAILPLRDRRPAALESPEELIGNVFPERDQPSSPALMALAAAPAPKIVTPEILDAHPSPFVEDRQEKVRHHAPVAAFEPHARTRKVASSAQRIANSPSRSHVLEISGFQVAAVVFLFAVLSLAVGLTVGRSPLGKRLRDTRKSIPAVAATSRAMLNRPGETTSQTSTPQAANTFVTPAVNPAAPATAGSPSESPSVPSLGTRSEDSDGRVVPTGPSSTIATRSFPDSDNPETSPEPKGSTGLIARTAPPLAISQPAQSPRTVGPLSGAPPNPAPRRVTPATHAATHLSSPSTILVTGPGDGSKPFKLILPEKTIAASSSFAMTSQLSVLVPPAHGPAPAHNPARLQAGELVSFVWPRYPRPGDRYASSETVKVRTTIGKLGQVLDIKLLSGSTSLLPAAMSAIRLWRYQPTLLNKSPVQAQQDVTIEFRPPQYLSRVSTPHPARN